MAVSCVVLDLDLKSQFVMTLFLSSGPFLRCPQLLPLFLCVLQKSAVAQNQEPNCYSLRGVHVIMVSQTNGYPTSNRLVGC